MCSMYCMCWLKFFSSKIESKCKLRHRLDMKIFHLFAFPSFLGTCVVTLGRLTGETKLPFVPVRGKTSVCLVSLYFSLFTISLFLLFINKRLSSLFFSLFSLAFSHSQSCKVRVFQWQKCQWQNIPQECAVVHSTCLMFLQVTRVSHLTRALNKKTHTHLYTEVRKEAEERCSRSHFLPYEMHLQYFCCLHLLQQATFTLGNKRKRERSHESWVDRFKYCEFIIGCNGKSTIKHVIFKHVYLRR